MPTDPFLQAAIDEAKKGLAAGGIPIGSVIVQRQGKLAGILSAIDVCRILGEYLESMFPNGRRGGDSAA